MFTVKMFYRNEQGQQVQDTMLASQYRVIHGEDFIELVLENHVTNSHTQTRVGRGAVHQYAIIENANGKTTDVFRPLG